MDLLKSNLIPASFILFFILACGSCTLDEDVVDIEGFLSANNISAQQTSSGLYHDILEVGEGRFIDEGDFLLMNITQYDLLNVAIGGNVDKRFPIAISIDGLIPGLQEGLHLLKKGGSARFFIPPALSGGAIQTGAIIYTLEVIEVYNNLTDYNDGEIEKYLEAQELSAIKTDDGIYVIIEESGADPKPDLNSTVTVDYHGYFLNGQVFDSSVERGKPAEFELAGVIEGWQLGIPLFGTGGKGTLFIPSNLAYNTQGTTSIPGNYPLVFDIELIMVQ